MAPASPEDDVEAIAARITELREALELTQAEFARRIDATPQALSNWERAMNRPSVNATYKISRAMGGVPPGYIWSGDTRGMPHEIMTALQKHRAQRKVG